MLLDHGGNIRRASDVHKTLPHKIIDFSSNINPLGINQDIREIIAKDIDLIRHYPDPEYKLAREGLAKYLGVNKDNILIGNGSNELIHLVPRALGCRKALIYQPAFSEYELSIRLSGAKVHTLFAEERNDFYVDIRKVLIHLPKVDFIILCNPNNPTGNLLEKDRLLELVKACCKNRTYLFIDEVFIEFVKNSYSLIKEAAFYKHILVLRSLTKFFSVPGLRIGYLVAHKDLLKKISLFQPTWSVNSFAQEVVAKGLVDSKFIKETKDYINKEKYSLFEQLQKIQGLLPYPPTANFIFCKILDKRLNSQSLSRRLLKCGILIRDCSNFKGLDQRFFRLAVRKRDDNDYLITCLKRILAK